jgi:hypothetical protein
MKKQEAKQNRKDVIAIALVWLFVLALVYIVYLKLRMI